MFLYASRQRGLALITVLMFFVLVVMLAVAMIERQELNFKRATNLLQRDELREVALGIEVNMKEMILGILNTAKTLGTKQKPYFYMNPLGFFATPLPEVGDFDLVIHISDPGSRLNLNVLSKGNNDQKKAVEKTLRKLLSNLGFEDANAMVEELKRWQNSDLNVINADYQGRQTPHRAGHQPLVDLSEFLVFEWLTEADRQRQLLNRLSLYVDTYPVSKDAAILNINNACKKLLESIFDHCEQCVQDILKARDEGIEAVPTGFMGKGFKTKDNLKNIERVRDFLNTKNSQGNKPAPLWSIDFLGIMTRWLEVYVRVQRRGSDEVFAMQTTMEIDYKAPKVTIIKRNFNPNQPLTLVNQSICSQ